MASSNIQPLIVILGPTASGKTAVAVKLAKKIDGEIICADSRTIYRGMEIGTAQPSKKEQDGVPHHLLNIADPDQVFTAANFQKCAQQKIIDIRTRHKVPIIVGGTGLYIDSILFDYTFSAQSTKKLREKLNEWTFEELWDYCNKNNIELPENKYNKRYVIRSIEQKGINKQKRNNIIENCFVVGIATEKEELTKRIEARAEIMFSSKLMQETQRLVKKYGLKHESMSANIYSLADKVNKDEISRSDALSQFVTLDRRLAKRQLTWFKRNPSIHWCERDKVFSTVTEYLSSRQV